MIYSKISTASTQRRGGLVGFTLIELLIVVAIISILAGIAVPNFLEAQTRSKVSRVKNDARALTVAVESYHVDNNRYPRRTTFPFIDFDSINKQFRATGDVEKRIEDMKAFTTPIAYITSLPVDVFEKNVAPPLRVLDYWDPRLTVAVGSSYGNDDTAESFGYLIYSVGPDGVFGNINRAESNYPIIMMDLGGGPEFRVNTFTQEYDPTNGTVSFGNISRFMKNGATLTDAFTK